MARITYVEFNGTEHTVDVEAGMTVMEGAVDNDIPGIVAECGGACSCATCHVVVAEQWYAEVGPPEEIEKDMLEFAAGPKATSRLSCQINVTDELDGLIVHTPESQY